MQGSFLIKDVLVIIVFSLYYNFRAKSRKLYRIISNYIESSLRQRRKGVKRHMIMKIHYFLLHSLGVTQVPVALQTTIGSSRKSAAEALMSGLA